MIKNKMISDLGAGERGGGHVGRAQRAAGVGPRLRSLQETFAPQVHISGVA